MIFFNDSICLFTCGRIRISRTGSDHIQRIPQNITEYNGKNPCRHTGERKTTALHAGKTLTYGVHFHNVCTACQKLCRNILQLFSRNQRFFKQCASPSGKKENNSICFLQAADFFQRPFGSGKTVFIRNRMSGFPALHSRNFTFNMVIFGNHNSVIHMSQNTYSCCCHLPCSFSG